MGFVFISYSRKDRKKVDSIVSKLQEDDLEVWIDRESIKGGKLWTVEIVEAIDTADSFVLMLSPNATESDNVRKEVHLAQDSRSSCALKGMLLAGQTCKPFDSIAMQLPPPPLLTAAYVPLEIIERSISWTQTIKN